MTNNAGAKGTGEEEGAVEGGEGSWNWSNALDSTNVEDTTSTVDKRYTITLTLIIFLFLPSPTNVLYTSFGG